MANGDISFFRKVRERLYMLRFELKEALFHRILDAIYLSKRIFLRRRALVVFPQIPGNYYMTWKILRIAGVRIMGYSPVVSENVVAFEDDTYPLDVPAYLREHHYASMPRHVINGDCRDISKRRVAEVFEKIFGYDLAVDPLTFHGRIVKKSDINARHDGEILVGPLVATDLEEGCSYQKLIRCEIDEELMEELRVVVIGGSVPVVFKRIRRIENWFLDSHHAFERVAVSDCLGEGEVENIVAFSREMGLEIGGLDVLRDREDGLIYIVDVNPTASGPKNELLSVFEAVAMSRDMGRAFIREYGWLFEGETPRD